MTALARNTTLEALAAQAVRCFAPGDGARVEAAEPAGAWFTFGVCPERAEGPGLLWARWAADSPHFRDVWNYRGAVGSETVSTADGDLWIGLAVPSGAGGEDLVGLVVEWLVDVHDCLGVVLTPLA